MSEQKEKVFESMDRLYERVKGEIADRMVEKFKYENRFQLPRIEKIVVNAGLGEASSEPRLLEQAVGDISLLTGQKPVVAAARKSIAGFKVRRGQKIGCFVTLRRKMMYDFLERMIRIYLPRVRDFRGLSPNSFDGSGNYTFGIKEQTIFPEINRDKIEHTLGLSVTLVTNTDSDEIARELLKLMGMPFRGAHGGVNGG